MKVVIYDHQKNIKSAFEIFLGLNSDPGIGNAGGRRPNRRRDTKK